MSNYHREWFPGHEESIMVGAEAIAGNGRVEISFCGTDEGACRFMHHQEAIRFAEFILAKAREAAKAEAEEHGWVAS